MKKNNRRIHSRSKQNSSNDDLKRFLPFFCLFILVIIVATLLWPKPDSQSTTYQSVTPTKPATPTEATIFLDNSASMEGYAHGNEYIDALADLMSIYPNTKVRFTNNTSEIESANELTNQLTRNQIHYKGQSLLNEDLGKIINQIVDKKRKIRKKIAFFVTDGILSGSDADIKGSKALGHKYNIDHKQDLMNNISEVFRGKGISAALFRMRSHFLGEYFCFDNSHKKISTIRSYYIIALGSPSVVADFKHKLSERQRQSIFKLRQTNEIDFIEPQAINHNLSITAGDVNRGAVTLPIENGYVSIDLQKISKSAQNGNPVYNFMIGEEAFINYSLSLTELASNLVVSIDGVQQKIKAFEDKTRKSIVFQIEANYLSLPNDGNKVRVYIPYFTPTWIDSPMVSNEDDTYMINSKPDESTFLFRYLINGIKNNGILATNNAQIYDKTVTFKRK